MSLLFPFTSFSSLANCTSISLCVSAYSLIFTNTLIILTFTSTAVLLFNIQDSMVTPYSVKQKGA